MGYVLAAFMVVFVVALCALCAIAVLSTTRGAGTGSRSVDAERAVDAAEEELRLRYARGEIDREEFLQRKIDLER